MVALRLGGAPIHADFFVIADGLVLDAYGRQRLSRTQLLQHALCKPAAISARALERLVEVHWRAREQLYITPLGEDEVGVSLLTGYAAAR